MKMMNNFYVINLVLMFVSQVTTAPDDCLLWLEKGSSRRPLPIEKSPVFGLLYPTDEGALRVPKGGTLRLSCLDKRFRFFDAKQMVVTCMYDDFVRAKKKQLRFRDLECEARPSSTVRKSNRPCYQNGVLYDVGYHSKGEFLPIMTVCYVEREAKTVYAYYNRTHLNAATPTANHFSDGLFEDDDLYDFDIAETYERRYQTNEFATILQSKDAAAAYVRNDGKHSLTIGRLMAPAYYVHGGEQAATFHYINAAPQWGIIRNGNWRKVVNRVRARLIAGPERYSVVTGTYGVATLPDSKNIERDLFLHRDERNQRLHPVPKFFWTIIYDREVKNGEVIISINNPYLKEVPGSYRLCKDICSQMKWFGLKRNTVTKGYVFCCEMNDFLRATGIENVFEERKTTQKQTVVSQCDDDSGLGWLM